MRLFGLIGQDIGHSFSPRFFAKKFANEQIDDASYQLFSLAVIEEFPQLIRQQPNLEGLNVTIPYKTAIIPFLNECTKAAKTIGAVNTIVFREGRLIGYNTDVYGFEQSLIPHLKPNHQKALILGTGGAAKAVAFVLNKLGLAFRHVSRTPAEEQFSYEALNEEILDTYTLIINATPLGMTPNTETAANIPYKHLNSNHLLYDLVYNPEQTLFLKRGKKQGAGIKNGLEMLHLQAERAWIIWNK